MTTITANNISKAGLNHLISVLLKGLLVLLPLTLVTIVFVVVFDFFFDLIEPISSVLSPGSDNPHWIVHILSILIITATLLALGLAIQTPLGKKSIKGFEDRVLRRIPLYSPVCDLIYQFAGMKKLPFSRVVLIDPYSNGVLMTGFVADESEDGMLTVFVPTAPNPTNGNIFHVPAGQAKILEVTPQSAMQTIVGMGTGSGKILDKRHPVTPQPA